jgi:hypothetical protein
MKKLILVSFIYTISIFGELDKYQIIIDRQPFGRELISPEPSVSSIKSEAEAIAAAKSAEKELRLCFIFETTKGLIRAGFQNKIVKAGEPKSIMLGVGDTFKGMKLVDVNIQESTATLDRNGVMIMFSLNKSAKNTLGNSKTTSTRKFNSGFRSSNTNDKEIKKEVNVKLTVQQQEQRKQEIQESLRQYQMDVIRAGLPPLPVPLTKQMDDQLVAEGVLPPEN